MLRTRTLLSKKIAAMPRTSMHGFRKKTQAIGTNTLFTLPREYRGVRKFDSKRLIRNVVTLHAKTPPHLETKSCDVFQYFNPKLQKTKQTHKLLHESHRARCSPKINTGVWITCKSITPNWHKVRFTRKLSCGMAIIVY